MTSLLFALILGGQNNAWNSPMTLGLLVNALSFLTLFYIIELKSPEPILPLNLFKLPMVTIPSLALFFLCIALIGLNVYLPMWVQGVLGFKATGSGIALIPMSVGWTLGAFYCGKLLIKIGIRNTTSLGVGDPAFAAYYNMDMENLDVEMGFFLAKPVDGKSEIKASEIPAGKQVSYLYKGPYTGMEPVYNTMMQWVNENGCTPTGVAYEFYYNSPLEVPKSELLTKIVFPLR